MNPNVLDMMKINGPDNTTTVTTFQFTNLQVVPGLFLLLVCFFGFCKRSVYFKVSAGVGKEGQHERSLVGAISPPTPDLQALGI